MSPIKADKYTKEVYIQKGYKHPIEYEAEDWDTVFVISFNIQGQNIHFAIMVKEFTLLKDSPVWWLCEHLVYHTSSDYKLEVVKEVIGNRIDKYEAVFGKI